ncbi:hypothetical protein JCM21531_1382 [Acetivibrio straminisolvens JCM 21531]|uniref:NADPH-dependent FMN reductase-like domain-containing protein n=1 Tax=Acetivibrio straminisolvens JCM 21531 TaxID=1294263 RepID=W4V466_9FIRM|nr:NAD(P)H-dependent oxidoreductase [Acetivibrio straminisolvens]GAE87971.1 hypothetical protein JCM21531_1382 [Acetivibrio straminisolvens JCM 21531]
MNVLVLNGSPKGEYSITLQTSLYLEKKFSEHRFQFLRVGQQIKSLERDFSTVSEAITNADLIIFSYPVYTFIAPSQLHRFIELLKASGLMCRENLLLRLLLPNTFTMSLPISIFRIIAMTLA